MTKFVSLIFFNLLCFSSYSQDSTKMIVTQIEKEIKKVAKEIKEKESYLRTLKKKLDTVPVKKSPWKYKGNFNLVVSEVVRGDWAAGGLSNYAVQGMVHIEQDLRLKKHEWDNTFDGVSKKMSGVINLEETRNPIQVAMLLQKEQDRILAGEGAINYAQTRIRKIFYRNTKTPARL